MRTYINSVYKYCQALEESALISNIYIYGNGFCAKFVYQYMLGINPNINIKAFVQTKVTSTDAYMVPVIDIWKLRDEIEGDKKYICIIATQNKYRDEIAGYLSALGIDQFIGFDFVSIAEELEQFSMDKTDQFWKYLNLYNYLQDEESRLVFRYGCLAKMSCDVKYFLRMQPKTITSCIIPAPIEGMRNIAEWFQEQGDKNTQHFFLYAPTWGCIKFALPRVLELGISIDGICTDNKLLYHKILYNKMAISLQELAYLGENTLVLIGCGRNALQNSVIEQMISFGIRKENILLPCQTYHPFCYGNQYFDVEEIALGNNEVFVDAGCFDCATVKEFLKQTCGKYQHIYSFEPDKTNYLRCVEIARTEKFERFTLMNKGLWKETTELNFNNEGLSTSKIQADAKEKISVVSLDEVLLEEPVSFIKMDIEGAEQEALKGAEKIIKKYKPKLAISIYHKPEDFIDILNYLLLLVPEYRFYIRHYSLYKYETILYATT